MKIVVPLFGLGNVMFQYAFLCELRHHYQNEACCFFVYRKKLFDHNGYELDRLFKVNSYQGLNWLQQICIHFLERSGDFGFPNFFLIRKLFKVVRNEKEDSFKYYDNVFQYSHVNIAYWGMWQSPKYFTSVKEKIINTYQFDQSQISVYTRSVLEKVKSTNSVCIHLRRGDYMNDQYNGGFSRCCPLEYYSKAIQYIEEKIENPTFFVFSDDIEYAKMNLSADSMFFIDGNKGDDSWHDMYLMSQCKHNIIANSTFSWWGAFLNLHENKIVIAPRHWWYYLEKDDIIPEDWIRI